MLSKVKKGDFVVLEKLSGKPQAPQTYVVKKIILSEGLIYLEGFDFCIFNVSDGSFNKGIENCYKISPYDEHNFRIQKLAYEKTQNILALRTFVRNIPAGLDLESFTTEQLRGFLELAKVRTLVEKYEAQLKNIYLKMERSLKILGESIGDS